MKVSVAEAWLQLPLHLAKCGGKGSAWMLTRYWNRVIVDSLSPRSGGLSVGMMKKIIERDDEYLTFWP